MKYAVCKHCGDEIGYYKFDILISKLTKKPIYWRHKIIYLNHLPIFGMGWIGIALRKSKTGCTMPEPEGQNV